MRVCDVIVVGGVAAPSHGIWIGAGVSRGVGGSSAVEGAANPPRLYGRRSADSREALSLEAESVIVTWLMGRVDPSPWPRSLFVSEAVRAGHNSATHSGAQ